MIISAEAAAPLRELAAELDGYTPPVGDPNGWAVTFDDGESSLNVSPADALLLTAYRAGSAP